MSSVEDIFERAKLLKRAELSRLITRLDEYLAASERKKTSRKKRPLYAGTLSLSGTAQSDYTDVSTNKYKHLAEIYATKHGR